MAKETDKPARVKRSATLRRNRRTTVQGLVAGDTVQTVFDRESWEWRLLIDSANGVTIRHERLGHVSLCVDGLKAGWGDDAH